MCVCVEWWCSNSQDEGRLCAAVFNSQGGARQASMASAGEPPRGRMTCETACQKRKETALRDRAPDRAALADMGTFPGMGTFPHLGTFYIRSQLLRASSKIQARARGWKVPHIRKVRLRV